jgi:hypothetical protein
MISGDLSNLITIDIEKAHNLRSPHRVGLLDIYLNKFGETMLVKEENEIMNKI